MTPDCINFMNQILHFLKIIRSQVILQVQNNGFVITNFGCVNTSKIM